ncbi:hypothetical protein [Streptomyces morookaense]|uniref:hypothetical protein n=1 Tax=Streptomyces morookaense TaxID=1970 RepID=UPI00159DE7D9|nr:hypothetical protein [Streptomyces morookaense]GHF30447.1 hypothetical protein GCM10010359_35690 [Streptomyces morookaense]
MIRVGVIGHIKSGDEQSKYAKIQELADDPPSYLILTAADRGFQFDGGDWWVEDEASLRQFFAEARWDVEWQSTDEDQPGN